MNTNETGVPNRITRMNSRAYGSEWSEAPNMRAYGIVWASAPKSVRMSSRNIRLSPPKNMAFIIQRINTLLTVAVALLIFPCPMKIELMAAPPAAISIQNAITKFIIGKVMASPAIAIAPTPRPMKIESMML